MFNNSYEFGFVVDWMWKDLFIVLDEVWRNGFIFVLIVLVD